MRKESRLAAVCLLTVMGTAGCGGTPVVGVAAPVPPGSAAPESPQPGSAPPSASPQAGGSARPTGTRTTTTTKPAPKPSGAAPPVVTVTAATLKVSPESYGILPCIQLDQLVQLDFAVQVSTKSPTTVKLDVESSAGLVRSGANYLYPARDGVASGALSTTVKVGPGRPETVTFWIQVTSPTSKQSSRVTFHNYCA